MSPDDLDKRFARAQDGDEVAINALMEDVYKIIDPILKKYLWSIEEIEEGQVENRVTHMAKTNRLQHELGGVVQKHCRKHVSKLLQGKGERKRKVCVCVNRRGGVR